MAQTATQEIVGTFVGERFRKEDWFVGSLKDGTTIVGNADRSEIRAGRTYRFFGEIVEHERFGQQFKFSGFLEEREAGEAGVVKYLSETCDGIGKVLAKRLYDRYGDETIDLLQDEWQRVQFEVPGLKADVAEAAAAALKRDAKFRRARVELIDMFAGRPFPKSLIKRLIDEYGPSAPAKVRRNPYLLMKQKRVGFGLADQLYLDLGGNPGRRKRQTLCLWDAFQRDSNGHTWFTYTQAREILNEKIGGAKADTRSAVDLGVRSKLLAIRGEEITCLWLTSADRDMDEERIVSQIRLLQTARNRWPQQFDVSTEDGDGKISEHQADGAMRATLSPVGCLVGSPGTGKTYLLATIIKSIFANDPAAMEGFESADLNNELHRMKRQNAEHRPVWVVAPTGKAAVRATESLAANGINIRASTIHKLLGPVRDEDGAFRFCFGPANPLPAGYLIVDEVSMVSADLMATLLAACPQGMHILFVGDQHQLAPVGHGAPLRDMLLSGIIPVGELTQIRRNAGTIVKVCRDLKEGKGFWSDDSLDPAAGQNLRHFQCTSPEMQRNKLRGSLQQIKESGHDLMRDCQILVSKNYKSAISREELNEFLQDELNADGAKVEGQDLRVGDKVICLKNGFYQQAVNVSAQLAGDDIDIVTFDPDDGDWWFPDNETEWVANGEIGYVQDIARYHVIVEFEAPKRTVKLSTKKSKDGTLVDLAYAITVHKSQGSQWPIVIAMIDSSSGANWMARRELWYTALSRASKYCLTIGRKETISSQCRRVGLRDRKTFLAERLRSALWESLNEEGF